MRAAARAAPTTADYTQCVHGRGDVGIALYEITPIPSSLQKKKACAAGFLFLLFYSFTSLNTSAMSLSYMSWSIRVTMLL